MYERMIQDIINNIFREKVYYQSGWTGDYGFCQNKTKVVEMRSKMEYVMFSEHRKYILLIIE